MFKRSKCLHSRRNTLGEAGASAKIYNLLHRYASQHTKKGLSCALLNHPFWAISAAPLRMWNIPRGLGASNE